MNCRVRTILLFCVASASPALPSSFVKADGGTVCLCHRTGNYQVAVFTSPAPFRAGTVDVSVLVQDARTGEHVPEARVTVCLTGRGSGQVLEHPASAEAATNKLFQAAIFELPEPGWWDVEVAVEGPHGPALLRFEVQAEEALPRWLELWPWLAWPALAVALFSLHQVLVRTVRAKGERKKGAPQTSAMGRQSLTSPQRQQG